MKTTHLIALLVVVVIIIIGVVAFTGNKADAPTTEQGDTMPADTSPTQTTPPAPPVTNDTPQATPPVPTVPSASSVTNEAPASTPTPGTPPTVLAGSYEPYSAEKIAMANDGPVVLFFKATWCPSCRVLDADIREHATTIPANVTILEVDYDTHTDLRKQYGVTTQHTLVQVDAQGNKIQQWSGGSTLDMVLTRL